MKRTSPLVNKTKIITNEKAIFKLLINLDLTTLDDNNKLVLYNTLYYEKHFVFDDTIESNLKTLYQSALRKVF